MFRASRFVEYANDEIHDETFVVERLMTAMSENLPVSYDLTTKKFVIDKETFANKDYYGAIKQQKEDKIEQLILKLHGKKLTVSDL